MELREYVGTVPYSKSHASKSRYIILRNPSLLLGRDPWKPANYELINIALKKGTTYGLKFMDDGDIYGRVVGLKTIECDLHDKRYGQAIRSVRK